MKNLQNKIKSLAENFYEDRLIVNKENVIRKIDYKKKRPFKKGPFYK